MGKTKDHNGLHIVNDTTECGRVVYWEMHGGTSFSALLEAFEESGLPEDLAPRPMTLDAVCRDIMRQFAREVRANRPRKSRGARVLVRPTDTGYALVEERRESEGAPLAYNVLVEAEPTGAEPGNDDGDDVFSVRVVAQFDDAVEDAARELHERLNAEAEAVSARTVSRWLVRTVMPAVGAVTLRDRGGVYFVPRSSAETFDKVARIVIGCSSHVVHQIPATTCREAVEAIVAALTAEVRETVVETEHDLDTGLTARKAGNRMSILNALQSKVRRYEDALSTSLGELHGQCDALSAELSVLALSDVDDSVE